MRLSQGKKSGLRRRLMLPYDARTRELVEEITKRVDEQLRAVEPKEVLEFEHRYPDLIRREGHTVIRWLTSCGNLYLSLEAPYRAWHEEAFSEPVGVHYNISLGERGCLRSFVKNLPQVKEWIKQVEGRHSLENRIHCALNGINTDKQLKREFPEAYALLEEDDKEPAADCADINDIRAELHRAKPRAKQAGDEG